MHMGHPGRARPATSDVDRISAGDLTTLVSDRGAAAMNIAAVLVVDHGAELEPARVTRVLAAWTDAVPRLRQRLRRAPPGCGRPYWADDPHFTVDRHVGWHHVAEDEDLLDVAADATCRRLPRDRPLWRCIWVTGLDDGRAALVVVVHHVLADGLGGLAMLGALAGSSSVEAGSGGHAPRQVPSAPDLAAEAWRSRAAGVTSLAARARLARSGLQDLGLARTRPRLSPRTSLNRPTGARRRLHVVTVPLTDLVATGHRLGVTVNDLVLAAVADSLSGLLRDRGESVDSLVVSVPYSGRAGTEAGRLGNDTGVVPFRIPLNVDSDTRLQTIARLTRDQRRRPRAASAAPLGVAFRLLARLGVFRWFVDRQRLVNTFVTNVRGPAQPWRFCDRVVSSVVPVAVTPGNVAVTFDVLSYAGTLGVTVVADPDVVPDQARLAGYLHEALSDRMGASD
ncbi:putative diacyglycerol O-acyltransferase [Terrabacter tumescens]|uniref:diacylglycerol O-acyltransferase n=1 Tax=Terrabacter tumescens TaxID=60443 RepID=A0ABQ2IA85_9MICO|nr:wax ester/triacylglycerol synthase domain-containing protein [Terrabacter tumescens]GGN02396.1 putative diacyglycerol O-acyltransferase [Terrabacter tumescens]